MTLLKVCLIHNWTGMLWVMVLKVGLPHHTCRLPIVLKDWLRNGEVGEVTSDDELDERSDMSSP